MNLVGVTRNGLANLTGGVAIVTGGSRGIGYGIATALAQAGANIGVVSRHLEEAQEAVAQLRQLGVQAMAVRADVARVPEIRAMVERVIQDLGKVDILVNNAGTAYRRPALDMVEEEWDAVLDTNLKGAFFCAQAVARHMAERGGGKIVDIASISAKAVRGTESNYAASKGASPS